MREKPRLFVTDCQSEMEMRHKWKWPFCDQLSFFEAHHLLFILLFFGGPTPYFNFEKSFFLFFRFLIPHLLLHHHLVTPNAVLVIWGEAKTKEVRFSFVAAMPWKHIRLSRCLLSPSLTGSWLFFSTAKSFLVENSKVSRIFGILSSKWIVQ